MLKLNFFASNQNHPKILCLGAHPDDIEIGCGGTLLRMIDEVPNACFYWVVFSGTEQRQKEAIESAEIFLKKLENKNIIIKHFQESYFPFIGAQIKNYFEELKVEFSPDVVFTHYKKDAHQDHRLISDLTWNTFRDHFILEYEIPKYDGDLSTPNAYVDLGERHVNKKILHILDVFETQKGRSWFTEDTFRSILRLRGIESNAQGKYAEGFYCRKIVF